MMITWVSYHQKALKYQGSFLTTLTIFSFFTLLLILFLKITATTSELTATFKLASGGIFNISCDCTADCFWSSCYSSELPHSPPAQNHKLCHYTIWSLKGKLCLFSHFQAILPCQNKIWNYTCFFHIAHQKDWWLFSQFRWDLFH